MRGGGGGPIGGLPPNLGVIIPARAEICYGVSAPSAPIDNSAAMSRPTLTVQCQWEDEMARRGLALIYLG